MSEERVKVRCLASTRNLQRDGQEKDEEVQDDAQSRQCGFDGIDEKEKDLESEGIELRSRESRRLFLTKFCIFVIGLGYRHQ
jgi:hypothetical protein